MADILTQPFLAFAGDNEAEGIFALKDYFSPQLSQNLWIDKIGRVSVIEGYIQQNATPITTNTGGRNCIMRSMFYYGKSTSGNPQIVCVVQDSGGLEYELWYSNDMGATWTFATGSDLGALAVGTISDFAVCNNVLVWTTPAAAPKQWDGTALTSIGPSQLGAPTPTDAAVAGNLSGKYQWKLRPITATGKKYGSVASAVLNLKSSQASLTWTADADTNVTGYELYRTTGIGAIWYYVDFINGRTTVAYTDNIPDTTIVQKESLEQHGDFSLDGVYFVEPHLGRAWYGRTAAFGRRWWFADAGFFDSVYLENHLDPGAGAAVDDVTTGATGDYYNSLILWLERSVWRVSGTGIVQGLIRDWNLKRTNARIGTIHQRTVLRIPAGAKYFDEKGLERTTDIVTLAYMSPLGDLRLFDGDNDAIMSHMKQDTLTRLNYPYRAKAHAVQDTKRDLAMWFLPVDTSTECNVCVVWDTRSGYMYTWQTFPIGAAVELPSNKPDVSISSSVLAAQLLLLAHNVVATNSGIASRMWAGTDLNGAPIEAKWVSKPIFVGDEPGVVDMVRTKRYRYIDLIFKYKANPTTVVVECSSYEPANVELAQALVPGSSRQRARLDRFDVGGSYLESRGVIVTIRSVQTVIDLWVLEGFTLGYQVLRSIWRTT